MEVGIDKCAQLKMKWNSRRNKTAKSGKYLSALWDVKLQVVGNIAETIKQNDNKEERSW